MNSSQLITIYFLHVLVLMQTECHIPTAICGRLGPNNSIPYITKSFSTNHHWPWHAAIYHQYNQFRHPIYQCGGTLIGSKSVLTAGHCVSINNVQLDVEQVSVWLGRLNLGTNENSGQLLGASQIIVHPNYNSIDYVNDIAVITLSADATFNNYVQPICLWKSDKTDISEVVGKFGTVVGWGLTQNGTTSNVLQQAMFPVVDVLTCLKSNRVFFGQYLSETNFCAGSLNGTGVCQGDSGGSITFEENGIYYIRGIVSIGQAIANPITQKLECDSMQYAIFTDVAKYLPWIKEKGLECETMSSCDPAPFSGLQTYTNENVELPSCGQLLPKPIPLMTHAYDTHHWPWHAAIYYQLGESALSYLPCGGTLITSKSILTAAHCVQIDTRKFIVFLGRLNLGAQENSGQSFEVTEVIMHPKFTAMNNLNNIAILKLSSDATFNHYVQPICLWKSDITDLSDVLGKFGTVVGWGLTEKHEGSSILQEASLPVVSRMDCLQSNPAIFGFYLSETNFCAGLRNGTSVCNGDSGGSMTFEENGIYYIRGIVSKGIGLFNLSTRKFECDSTQYVVFTDVAKYLSWIRDNQ